MTVRTLLASAALASVACADQGPASGDVSIDIQQSLTSQVTSAGTFTMTGFVVDDGATTEELTFGGPLTQSPVPVTFRRTLSGKQGTMVLRGSASLAFTSPATATLTGTWEVESATGAYAGGKGTLTGSADFAATPPRATLRYSGVLSK